jgi:hypothetical protein
MFLRQGDAFVRRRIASKLVRHSTALASTCALLGTLGAATPAAHAWAWDPNVQVIATTYSCGISATSGWAWFSADDGESGWATRGNSGTIVFNLHRVPGWGASTLVTIKWGVANCSQVRYRVITRPGYGNQQWLGNLG